MVSLIVRKQDAAGADVDGPKRIGRDGTEREKIDGFGNRMNTVGANVFGGENRRRRGSGGPSLGRLRSGGDDGLVQQIFETSAVVRARRANRHAEDGESPACDEAAAATHSNTFISLSASDRRLTCCFRAWPR